MNHQIRIFLSCVASALAAAGAQAAIAEPTAAMATTPTAIQINTAASDSPFSSGNEVRVEALAALRGGTDLVTNEQKLNGTVGTNVADNVVTGSNSITAGAFANMAGIPIVIQNSGANVLIQNATIINLQMQ